MAAGAAAARMSSFDPRAELRLAQTQAKRARQSSTWSTNLAPLNASLGRIEPLPTPANSPFPSDMSRDEAFRRTYQANKIRRDIGTQAGLSLERRPITADQGSIDTIIDEVAQDEADLYEANQLGYDTRTASAKRSDRDSRLQRGAERVMQQGLQKVGNEVAKEGQKIAIAYGSDVLIVGDTVPVDYGATQVLTFAHKSASAIATILIPEQDTSGPVQSVADLRQKVQATVLEAVIVRMGISRPSRIGQTAGYLGQLLIIAAIFLAIVAQIAIFAAIVDALRGLGAVSPLYTISYMFGFFFGE